MADSAWFILIGALLLIMGLSETRIRRWPVTSAMVYLAVGVVVGPTVLNLFHFNPLEEHALLERITEAAVLLSLFTAGMKMPVPVRLARWRTPILLATLAMVLTAALMTAFGVWFLGLPLGAAILLAGILAPTDPVLATDVQVRHPGDRDRLRFGLTCEAGMNDGTAFPVVMLGLCLLGFEEAGVFGWRWVLVDVLWFSVAGVVIGAAAGVALGRFIHWLRRENAEHHLMDDFIGLGLIATTYGVCLAVDAGGFLAVFFAAVALRQTETRLSGRRPEPQRLQTAQVEPDEPVPSPRVTDGSLLFKEQLERLSELVLIVLIGGTLFLDSWSWRAVATALFLMVVARPLGSMVALAGGRSPWRMRGMMSWFGVRGIGSLYYVMYAIGQGLSEELSLELIHLILIVVTLSIVLHGISVKPMLLRLWRPASQRMG